MFRDGVPVDVCNENGLTALEVAVNNHQTDFIKRLLLEGTDVNRQDRFKNVPLHFMVRENNSELTRLLLNERADINIKTNENKTPLDEARKGSEVERLLLQLQQSAP